jgi:hypothetical protein
MRLWLRNSVILAKHAALLLHQSRLFDLPHSSDQTSEVIEIYLDSRRDSLASSVTGGDEGMKYG